MDSNDNNKTLFPRISKTSHSMLIENFFFMKFQFIYIYIYVFIYLNQLHD